MRNIGKENNPRWNGGVSEYPDHAKLKIARLEKLRSAMGKCEICGGLPNLIHHINGEKANHELSNLIVLCKSCHNTIHSNDFTPHKIGASKFRRLFGKKLWELAREYNVCTSTIYHWMFETLYPSQGADRRGRPARPERQEFINKYSESIKQFLADGQSNDQLGT